MSLVCASSPYWEPRKRECMVGEEQSHCKLLPISHLHSGGLAAEDCGLPGPVGQVPAASSQIRCLSPDKAPDRPFPTFLEASKPQGIGSSGSCCCYCCCFLHGTFVFMSCLIPAQPLRSLCLLFGSSLDDRDPLTSAMV